MNKKRYKIRCEKKKKYTLAYLDHVILFKENLEDHLNGIRIILVKFVKEGLKLKLEKVKVMVPKLFFSDI